MKKSANGVPCLRLSGFTQAGRVVQRLQGTSSGIAGACQAIRRGQSPVGRATVPSLAACLCLDRRQVALHGISRVLGRRGCLDRLREGG